MSCIRIAITLYKMARRILSASEVKQLVWPDADYVLSRNALKHILG